MLYCKAELVQEYVPTIQLSTRVFHLPQPCQRLAVCAEDEGLIFQVGAVLLDRPDDR